MEEKENIDSVEQENTQTETVELEQVPVVSKDEKQSKPKKKTKAEREQEKLAEYEGLSDDEIYTKIQTEKLLSKKKKGKIATIVSLCLTFVLAVTLIVMASVPVTFIPKCLSKDFSRVNIYPGTTTSGIAFEEGSDGYNRFMELYSNSFSQTYISALFSGNIFEFEIEENWDSVPTLSEFVSNSGYVAYLQYEKDQTLTYRNGKKYSSRYHTSLWNYSDLTFREVYVKLNKEAGMQNTTFYIVVNNYPVFDGANQQYDVKTTGNLIKVTVKADTYSIYKAYDELEKL